MPGKCAFQQQWLIQNETLAKWLRPVEGDKHKAFCTICKTEFDVSHSGINSVRLHQRGKKHSAVENALLNGKQTLLNFNTATKQSPCTSSLVAEVLTPSSAGTQVIRPGSSAATCAHAQVSTSLVSSATGLQSSFLSAEVTKAEILWAMAKVMSHSSNRSFGAVSELFPRMFPDSVIASKFKMHKDKLSYVVTFGLGPYFENALVQQLKKCEHFCVSFDESLNKVAQMGQMDLIVRFWDAVENKVHTQYLTSVFLKRSRALDLLEGFCKVMSDFGLPLTKIIQIAVDGPNVNLKFLEEFKRLMKEETSQSQEGLDIGTCSLHVVNNAYKTAHKKSGWQICSFLQALYFLFKDFPSRRAKFKEVTGTDLFPMKLCTIRWTENSKVLSRAIAMIPGMKLYIESVRNDPPESKNFLIVQRFLKDTSLTAKLCFLQSVVIELEPFLTRFQAEKPMVPFLYSETYSMCHSIASRFVKKEVMASVVNGRKLQQLDFKKAELHLSLQAIDVGFGARAEYKNMTTVEKISFQNGCKAFFFLHLFGKLTISPKSPLSKCLVKGLSCLSPSVMLNEAVRKERITLMLKELVGKKHLAPIEGDVIKKKYLEICERSSFQSAVKEFNEKKDRLDEFFSQHLDEEHDVMFGKLAKKVLSLFHGNADVERGFSVNKECLVENLQEQSLVAQRCVYSSVTAAGGLKKIEITSGMINSVSQASKRRKEALSVNEAQKRQKEKDAKELVLNVKRLEEKKRKLQQESDAEMSALLSELDAAKKKLKLSGNL